MVLAYPLDMLYQSLKYAWIEIDIYIYIYKV